MKKKYFMVEYLVEGLILTTAATDYIPHAIFLALLAGLMLAVYFKDGFQITTLYYIPMALGLIVGRHFEMKYTDTSICLAIVLMQYSENNVYELPQNKKIVGFRSSQSKDEEIYQFFPLQEEPKPKLRYVKWAQGKALEKVIESKQASGLPLFYHRLTLSYLDKMKIQVGEGVQKETTNGMAFCHGRDAATLWYSSLFIHFASNDYKVVARQYPDIKLLNLQGKAQIKEAREQEVKIIADQYYESIQKLNCDKIILVGHSYGCSALLKAYFDHKSELQSKVTHIILMDPYFFPLEDRYLIRSLACPVLVLANEYLLNFEDMHQRLQAFTNKENVQCVVWKEGSDLYQTDLCFFFKTTQNWQAKFQMNFEAINAFMQKRAVEGTFGENDLGKQHKPQTFLPEKLFSF